MKKLLSYLFVISFFMISCEQEEKIATEKEIKFTFSQPTQTNSSNIRTNSQPDPVHVLVTIKTADGRTVADRKELTLYKFGETFLTAPLTLKTTEGTNYWLTEFFVLDENHQVVYVTPKEGSELAHLVSDALAIEFAIIKDQITTVTPEVLAVDVNADPSHYGYGQFGFKVVETINTVFSSFVKGTSNFELTESHIKIEGLADSTGNDTTALWSYEKDLEAIANKLVIKRANSYRITATKPGYTPWRLTTIITNNQAFEIIFDQGQNNDGLWNISFNQFGLDYCHEASPTRDGGGIITSSSDFAPGNNLARLGSNGKLLWRKRYTDYERMGSRLNQILQSDIEDSFYWGGSISCSLLDPDKCTLSEFSEYTGWITKVDGSGNYLWSRHIPNTTYVTEITLSHTSGNVMVFGGRHPHQATGILPQYVLTELNANGDIVWQKTFLQGPDYDTYFSRVQDGYLVSKIYNSLYSYANSTVIKHKMNGEVQWVNENLPNNWYSDWFQVSDRSRGNVSILENSQGYLVTGTQRNVRNPKEECASNLPDGATDIVVTMLSQGGSLLWSKTISRPAHEIPADSKLLPNGNVLLGGTVHTDCRSTSNYLPRWFFMEITLSGEVVSENILRGSVVDTALGQSPEMYMNSICQISNNEYIVVGATNILDGDTPDYRKYYRSLSDIWAMKLKF